MDIPLEVQAIAITNQIERTDTSITFGLFAKPGSGKSFLLKRIKDNLTKSEKSHSNHYVCRGVLFWLIFVVLLTICIIILLSPFELHDEHESEVMRVGICVAVFLLLFLVILRFSFDVKLKKYGIRFVMVLLFARFTKLPICRKECNIDKTNDLNGFTSNEEQTKKRFIFVHFNAWKYTGSDNLWASIVLSLADEIEKEFSSFTTRIFRGLNLDKTPKAESRRDMNDDKITSGRKSFFEHFQKHPKRHCYFQDLYCVCGVTAMVLIIPAFVSVAITSIQYNDKGNAEERMENSIELSIAWLPAGLGVLYTVVSIVWALLRSQTNRLVALLQGLSANLATELGFMHLVQQEVEYMIDLIYTVEYIYQTKYRVIISIEDLDRIPLNQVKCVLQAVNILLSDPTSPFICLIAADSKILVQSLELDKSICGRDYLKKIINVPFCPQKITNVDKKRFLSRLSNMTTTTADDSTLLMPYNNKHENEKASKQLHEIYKKFVNHMKSEDVVKYLEGNLTNLKHIANVALITASMIVYDKLENKVPCNSNEENAINPVITDEKFIKYLMAWVILTEQWPYRSVCIIRALEEIDSLNERDDLETIYNYVQNKGSCKIDKQENVFMEFIKEHKLPKNIILQLVKYTTNIDQNLIEIPDQIL